MLIVGCGGLGCPLAQYLAAAGIGRFLMHGIIVYQTAHILNSSINVLEMNIGKYV